MTTLNSKKMFWLRYYLFSVILLLTVIPLMAKADKQYPATIVSASQSPVTLTKCEAWARDWNKTALIAHVSSPNYLFDLGIAFTNNSTEPVVALRIKLASYDSFDNLIGSSDVSTQMNESATGMSVAPGASFELLGPQSWHGKNGHPDRDHVSCEITAVRFADGSVWSAPQPSPMSQGPTSSHGTAEKLNPDVLIQLQSAVGALAKLRSATSVGLTFADYSSRLADTAASVDSALAAARNDVGQSPPGPWLELDDTKGIYAAAEALWNKQIQSESAPGVLLARYIPFDELKTGGSPTTSSTYDCIMALNTPGEHVESYTLREVLACYWKSASAVLEGAQARISAMRRTGEDPGPILSQGH